MKLTAPADSTVQKSISPNLKRKIDRHLYVCSATIGASVALAAGGRSDVKGDIIYSGTVNATVPFNNGLGLYFDFDTLTMTTANVAGVSDLNLFDLTAPFPASPSYTYHRVTFFGPNNTLNRSISANGSDTDRLGSGVTVGPGGAFDGQNDFAFAIFSAKGVQQGNAFGNWLAGGTGFIGFKFVDANSQTDFGWMRLTFDQNAFANGQASLMVVDYAYDNTGQSITTGMTAAVPEPSSTALGFLAGGAAGLCAWRRHRRANLAGVQS